MGNYIPVITREYIGKVDVDDIIYIEQRQRRMAIVTENNTYVCYERIENIEKALDKRFYHTLNKLIVNLDKIIMARDQIITFQGGQELCLARECFIRTKQAYAAYLKELL